MTQQEIEKIITNEVEGSDGSYPKNVTPAAKEIYKLHLEAQLDLLEELDNSDNAEFFNNFGLKIKVLNQELKTLEE